LPNPKYAASDALALYQWSRSVNWFLAEGYENGNLMGLMAQEGLSIFKMQFALYIL